MQTEPLYTRLPKVPMWRRACALFVDILPVWLLSSLLVNSFILDFLVWLGLRVLLVSANQGQSLGRWAFDMKVVDERFGKSPGLLELTKREVLTGIGASLAVFGVTNLNPSTAQYLLLIVPLLLDCSLAYFDPMRKQAFHDRFAATMVVSTRRGYSLDIKVKKWVAQLRRFVKQ
ncbi:RDD family protein [Microcoleus sp. FACHB-68]|uniref:RDD family protein n=1 Tax=Microcoleus sp. FACHB-68 TaxID=2692826 RepID=UPI00168313FD|nr:RDD family protein [Microcoleus sp. FACHB-68]MBD1940516.1 RDD family protein [Microcoleus sp. FACHB-68]